MSEVRTKELKGRLEIRSVDTRRMGIFSLNVYVFGGHQVGPYRDLCPNLQF